MREQVKQGIHGVVIFCLLAIMLFVVVSETNCVPSAVEISTLLEAVDYIQVRLEGSSVCLAVGMKPDGSSWRLGLRNPFEGGTLGVLEVSNLAASRAFYEECTQFAMMRIMQVIISVRNCRFTPSCKEQAYRDGGIFLRNGAWNRGTARRTVSDHT